MRRLLPPVAAVAETFEDVVGATLLGDEEAAVERAVQTRRREFATGRDCARRALRSLGLPPAAIGSGRRGEPLWPPGIVGSITHCAGYRGCALAKASNLASIGIDAEPHEALPEGVLPSVATPTERRQLRDLARRGPEIHWDRLLFSAKECVYKAWFPLTHRWLDFADAEVSVDCDDGAFSARLLVPGPMLAGGELTTLSGRWLVCNGLVATAIAVAPAQP
jgi:4'-phosphopantetheinyl transferase EntD